MVSARTGVGPAHAIRRTAAAAPAKTFTPRIPIIPFILAPARLKLTGPPLSQRPAQHKPGAGITEPPARVTQRKLCSCSIRATLLIQNGILTGSGARPRRRNWRAARAPAGREQRHQRAPDGRNPHAI